MWIVLVFGIGFLSGILFLTLVVHRKTAGTLWISRADFDENFLIFLELSRGVETLANNRHAVLKVRWK